jgi:hypothetical protein
VSEVLTIVDNQTALENVSRMVKTLQLESLVDEKEGQYYISIFKEEGLHGKDEKETLEGNTVIMISSNVLGSGDDKLGGALMKVSCIRDPDGRRDQVCYFYEQRGSVNDSRI